MTIKGFGTRIKMGEDKELERIYNEEYKLPVLTQKKKFLPETSWKGKVDLGWLHFNNDQHLETGFKADKEFVFSVIRAQMKLFLNSAGNGNGSKKDITEEQAISFELWVNQCKTFKEIAEILQVSSQMIARYLTKLFVLIDLTLSSGINIKSKLLEPFFTPAIRALMVAKERRKGFRVSKQTKEKRHTEWALNQPEFVFTNQAGDTIEKVMTDTFKKIPLLVSTETGENKYDSRGVRIGW
ncbi:hypothetical protein NDK43_03650 [Neobacillus pocheonensis]|uniref:Uncharacterized protein n=1 Tax=Neobacillus pocheonensis TaxID=363869 RepID=A0ABT0W5P5_9BACI|nr:hypothetical protein [Neobacillus pocheonensis]